MKNKKKASNLKKQALIIILVLVVGVSAVFAVWTLLHQKHTDTTKGVAYLETLEAKDIKKVESKVKQVHKETRDAKIEDGSLSLWSQFEDCVILGDSRAEGFSFFGFLDTNTVIAEKGLTVLGVSDYMEQIKTENPSALVICVGVNDVDIGLWPTTEEYIEQYEIEMQKLKENVPNTHVYVNSILPVLENASAEKTSWKRIPEYNEAIKAWCAEKGYSYIDSTSICEENQELYGEDGVHFVEGFYQYWGLNILDEVNM